MLKKILKSYDYTLIVAMVLLSLFGVIMIYSASMVSSVQYYGHDSSSYYYKKQIINLLVAGVAFIFVALFPYKAFMSNRFLVPMVLVSVFGLFGVFLLGHVAGNAQSWYKVGTASLQPAEFVKLSVIIYLSAIYAKKQSYINEFNRGVAPPLAYLVLVCALVGLQPDFGTAAIIFMIAATIIVCSGMNMKNLMKLAGIGLAFGGFLALVMQLFGKGVLTAKQLSRIFVFLDSPFSKEVVQGSGYQMSNSLLAIGGGGLKGLGLGQGIQKLGYLTDGHTDFIMAVIAEELGIFGVGFVVVCLSYIVLRGIYIGLKCKDPFGSLLAIGISSMIGIQSFINIGGVSGVIPLTGVPLPFVSYGGSSLVQLAIGMGILLNVSMFTKYEKVYKNKEEDTIPSMPKSIRRKRFAQNERF
ncbi:FtsW/RodA/SpoVE family cell cycle protein [Niallia taxi]|uniref:FtsW/RodA/SpoVE family cell cycle protein n=1 Tax=Niallia taxi TaxID=2499688 RepID=UPI0011AA6AC3|nr:FtsW/RodA/SpoVE family cell cycle protein [Niallia taxi]MCT2344165.1 FtsW/RodA/SpoVE family cell cycle protein [Niallia taxi]WOD62191.1 FtsW/RodA/SpoVE family cell cycle protein [Niallia taxi]